MERPPNFLFIMCDQLRWDYLAYAGHPTIRTPHIDRLARQGVAFRQAYVQSPVCGPSRMSIYTGRTVFSHGASWNSVPLPIGEHTIGDYLGERYRVAVVGKTHVKADAAGMRRLGLTLDTEIGLRVAQGGFERFERDDGVHTDMAVAAGREPTYNRWLRSRGYDGANPWHDYANSVVTESGEVISGWELKAAPYPIRVSKEESETAYMTGRAMEFIDDAGDTPWLLHLSYIKPHWPYVAPAPYHAMYSPADVIPAVRHARERDNPHPVYRALMDQRPGRSFSDEHIRRTVCPAYMGLITQIDDEIARLVGHLRARGLQDRTVIVFTSDHGDYLGDHWLGEKEFFHDQAVRVPLILVDPRAGADATRGRQVDDLVESIDILPTLIDLAGLPPDAQRLEGRSLAPFLAGRTEPPARDAVFAELDFSFYEARRALSLKPNDARIFMIRTRRWKYLHHLNYRPQLFDLREDPDEYDDLGDDPGHRDIRQELSAKLLDRLARRRYRATESDASVESRTAVEDEIGVFIGKW